MSSLIYRWFLSQKPLNSDVSELETSLNIKKSIQSIKNYRWTWKSICHYGFMASILLFTFITNPLPWIIKCSIYSFLILLFLIPLTSQFFFNALPIFTWLSLYFTSSYFSPDKRPPITVKVLPAIETILYGDNLSDILATSTNSFLDILAWIPYGLFHFGAPFVVAAILFIFGPPTILQGYAFAFGYMNLFGVIIQNFFPAAPPWYKILYGLQSAHYGMHGSPGGLARIDQLLHINLYTNGFENSSVIFGAFPSLHSGCATMEALFFSYCFPFLRPLFIGYVCWLWWSTMYLTHHYFVDLMAGSVLSYVIFQYTKYTQLPLVDTSLLCRWSYSTIEKYDMVREDPLSFFDNDDIENIPLASLDNSRVLDLNDNSVLEFDLDDQDSVAPTNIFDRNSYTSRSSATSNISLDEIILPPRVNSNKRID
ncbi:inositol phosphorylceramide synthase PWA37_003024 [Arxiozyma heterogenica]|uniref:inositol phosphorylceramide synthase n=1 Tax=Arxiozyma heterogenica TaxID=278026 RepID=UPI002EF43119